LLYIFSIVACFCWQIERTIRTQWEDIVTSLLPPRSMGLYSWNFNNSISLPLLWFPVNSLFEEFIRIIKLRRIVLHLCLQGRGVQKLGILRFQLRRQHKNYRLYDRLPQKWRDLTIGSLWLLLCFFHFLLKATKFD